MKGIIFNLLEAVVVADHGDDAWDDLLARAGLDGAYTSVGGYPDGEFDTLLDQLDGEHCADRQATLRWFGRRAMPLLAVRYPGFFEGHRSTVEFLYTLNDIIHAEVRKLYRNADVPTFDFSGASSNPDTGETGITLGYASARRLCALAEGFIGGAAARYGEVVAIEQPVCMLRDDSRCVLVCSFSVGENHPSGDQRPMTDD